jgi:penicillin-binding protein 1A
VATTVYDREGGLLAEIGPEARTWVRLVDLPVFVGQAFIAIEDRRFYQHDGVDVIGVVGALRDNILRGFGSRGASTITQQLVGAMGFVDRRDITPARKIREAALARALERRHTKSEILEAYLNYINFGHGWYGVESAARHYFGKHAFELTLAEAALLAALPRSPVQYDPRAHPQRATERRNLVLQRMQQQRFITAAQARAAAREPLRIAPDNGYSVRAPYAVESVRQWLADRYGLAAVNTGGLVVYTTIDPSAQRAANQALARGLARVESLPGYRRPRYGQVGLTRGDRTPYLQGLLVSVDPRRGDVLALVGGRDFRDSEFNRAVQGQRQAGSAFKPFVYATALAQGLPPTAILVDSPLTLRTPHGPPYQPANSDGSFSGPVTMRTALVRSINVPAVRLGLAVGLDSVIVMARRLGISTPIPPYPSISIGAAEVRPIELIASYGAFATLGRYAQPRLVTLVQDASGIPIYEAAPPDAVDAVDPRVAFQVVNMLEDAVARGTGTGALSAGLPAGLPVAGKTGTTDDNADVWFIGMTPDLVAGVWIGFDRPQTIARGAFGGTLAAPVWSLFAREVYSHRPIPTGWSPPDGLVTLRVRRSDGALALSDTTDASVTEYFLAGTEPSPRSIAQRLMTLLRLP